MSRFSPTRRNRILAWTGAALAWSTAVTAARLEPARAQSEPPTPTAQVNETTTQAAVPAQPVGGLVILRYKPQPEVTPSVRTVYVKKPAPPAAAAPAPKPTPKPAPAPRSRGS